jgi:hypothetical protein
VSPSAVYIATTKVALDIVRTYAVDPQTVVGAGFFRDFSLVAQSLDQPALTGFFILKCVSPDSYGDDRLSWGLGWVLFSDYR